MLPCVYNTNFIEKKKEKKEKKKNTGAIERSEAARARSLAGATVGGAVRGLVRVL